MRMIGLLALLAVAGWLPGNEAWAQAPTQTPVVQANKSITSGPVAAGPLAAGPVAGQPADGQTAAQLAGRPDAWRYYWHDGQWWYFTAQNNWLRWNGTAWVRHYSINDSGAFSQGRTPQPNVLEPSAGGYYYRAGPVQTFRYQINRRMGGL